MARPGFYNDNEYRSYPFVDKPLSSTKPAYEMPDDAIVDAGFIMGLDAQFDDSTHKVQLSSVSAADGLLRFTFIATAPDCVGKNIVFTRSYYFDEDDMLRVLDKEWALETAESNSSGLVCADEPVWSGFLVTGKLEKLIADVDTRGGFVSFAGFYEIEPARIQNLNKAYLRSISVGNYERTKVPPCENTDTTIQSPQIIMNAACLQGELLFKAGYNARIRQSTRARELYFAAERGSGQKEDTALCSNHGEIPFYDNEVNEKPFVHGNTRSKFLSGGWSCKDLIFTINGVGGSNVNLVGGKNVEIGYDDTANAITVTLSKNAGGSCSE